MTRLTRGEVGFVAETTRGPLPARQVVVATGPFQVPVVPGLAGGLDPQVAQVHSGHYRSPAGIGGSRVLVVGAGNSGLQIAEELAAAGRTVTVAVGRRPRPVPQRPLGRDLFWWLTRLGLVSTPADSRLARRLRRRELVVGVTWRGLRRQGTRLAERAVRAQGRTVTFADGRDVQVDAVVWATGCRADHSWIDVCGAVVDGEVVHSRGLSPVPGLAFLGLPWQHTRGSALLGFVRHDAEWLADRLAADGPAPDRARGSRPSQVPA